MVPLKDVMEQLNIETGLNLRPRWYRSGKSHRLEQPVGRQYSYGKGLEYALEIEKLKAEKGVRSFMWLFLTQNLPFFPPR
ncbi:hypothetical protein [Paenibacillus elgii]|uniref:hypothetical protein n=1 Tax=Paenibacillus elgii TaxID=189691 RepID=UPI0007C75849|nr:hypothetical protein [Paenibacillus elgii]